MGAKRSSDRPGSLRPTLRDVSQYTGLSIYSVSRALAGESGVSDVTRERVRQAARDVGYVPNQLARSLKGNTSRTIGVIAGGTANEYYATLLGAFGQALRDASFQTLLADTMPGGDYDVQREATLVGSLLEQRVSAIVVTYSLAPENLQLIDDWKIPVVFVDCDLPDGYAGHPAVAGDSEAAGWLVGDHLANHGYKQWAFIGYPRRWSSRIPRERGFVESAKSHGATVDVLNCDNDSESPYLVLCDYLGSHPEGSLDAIYCANTPILQGSLRAIREDGRRVGRDVAVVAFDEFPWSGLLDPSITVVDQHISSIGRAAAELLLNELHDGASDDARPAVGTRMIKPHLVVRSSCGCPPG